MPTYTKDYFVILKETFDAWVAINDAENVGGDGHNYELALSQDQTCYIIPVAVKSAEERAQLLAIPSCRRILRTDLDTFIADNPSLYTEPEPGDSPAAKALPAHPLAGDLKEFANLYNNTNADMSHNPVGNSTWAFPQSTMPNGVDDVHIADNYIQLPRDKFGPAAIDDTHTGYHFIDANNVLLYVWPIVSKSIAAGTVTVTLTIPPTAP